MMQAHRIFSAVAGPVCGLLCFAFFSVGSRTNAQETTDTVSADQNATTTAATIDTTMTAEEAAQKLTVEPGQSMRTTEASTGQTSEAVAAPPSLVIREDKIVLPTGETTETAAVKNFAELLKQMNIVAPKTITAARGQREMDETTPTNVLKSEEARSLIQDKPTVLYRVVVQGTPLPDPMIVPWIRNTKVLEERWEEALDLLGRQQFGQGREALTAIITEFPESDFAVQARKILQLVDQQEGSGITAGPVETPKASAPVAPTATPIVIGVNPSIKVGTVVTDRENPEDSIVVVNGKAYRSGDTIQGFNNHRVVSISDDTVVFEVEIAGQTREIPLSVRKK